MQRHYCCLASLTEHEAQFLFLDWWEDVPLSLTCKRHKITFSRGFLSLCLTVAQKDSCVLLPFSLDWRDVCWNFSIFIFDTDFCKEFASSGLISITHREIQWLSLFRSAYLSVIQHLITSAICFYTFTPQLHSVWSCVNAAFTIKVQLQEHLLKKVWKFTDELVTWTSSAFYPTTLYV